MKKFLGEALQMTDFPVVRPTNSYLIYVNLIEYQGDVNHLKEYVSQNRIFESWWSYTPGIFFITSKSTTDEISDTMFRFLGGGIDYFAAKIDPHRIAGRLTPGAWDAFDKDIRDRL